MSLGGLLVAFAIVGNVACSKTPGPTAAPTSDDRSSTPKPKHEDRHEAATAKSPLRLEVTIAGQRSTWQQDVFDKVPHFVSENHDGEARDTWSLRELVHQVVGPSAHVVAVVGTEKKTLDEAAWNDPSRTPILHTTRRGTLKFRWADKTGKWGETEVKEVVGLEIVP